MAIRCAVCERAYRAGWCMSEQFWTVSRPLTCSADHGFTRTSKLRLCGFVALRCLYDRARMFVARLWFLTHTVVRQGYHLGPRLFRRSYDAGVSEWHAELDQLPWPQRLTCTCESDTLLSSAVLLATGGYADDLAGTCIVRSHTELDDIDQLTTSSLAAAWRRRALLLHPKKGVTLLRLQERHSFRELRAALLGNWKAP